jgi:hypothetical protein
MSTEERIYKGNLIQGLIATVDRIRGNPLRHYVLQNSAGSTYGCVCEMLQSEADSRNSFMAVAHSDYRWTIVPEKGSR